jgi:hypothetical protein
MEVKYLKVGSISCLRYIGTQSWKTMSQSNSCIARWTVGDVSEIGFSILERSISLFKFLYPNIERFICYNNLNSEKIDFISSLDCNLVNQHEYEKSLPYKPEKAAWKLYPPRLDITKHEIVLDNDLILYNHSKQIENFLNGDVCLVCKGKHFLFGSYSQYVPKGIKLNCGLYGMPKGFDFGKKINNIFDLDSVKKYKNFFDDQGIVAACLLNYKNIETFSIKDISIIEFKQKLVKGNIGVHFVQANRNKNHKGWEEYDFN